MKYGENNVLYVEDYQFLISHARGGHVRDICPFCHDRRTNKKDKCLSIDVKTLGYYCHYCNSKGYLKSRMSECLSKEQKSFKPMAKQTYIRPKQKEDSEIKPFSESFLEYFKGRGISESTLKELKVTQGTSYFPQLKGKSGCIEFNYYFNDELINVKSRTRNKDFTLVTGAQLIPYNINSIAPEAYEDGETKYCIYVEGECFSDTAEILTKQGWKLFKDLSQDDLVAQYLDGRITFVKPLALVRKEFNGKLVEFSKERRSYYSLTTPNHNLVVSRNNKEYKMKASEISSPISVKRSAIFDGEGIILSDDEIRIFCAVSADFTIRETGDLYASFKKNRKVSRITSILDKLGIRYSKNIDNRGYNSIFIHRGHGLFVAKDFPMEWISKLSKHQIELILEEVIHWDGNHVKGRTMLEYNSNRYNNVLFIQTLCHLSGRRSVICKRSNEHGSWYKATIIQNPNSFISIDNRKDVDYNGYVYCVTVPSGMIMVRQNEQISISGNCDALTYHECGYKHVVSVPNGANVNLEYLDEFIDSHFDKLDVIYISVDNDKKGLEVRAELIRRFGSEMCKLIDYPKPCKDINEVLMKYGKDAVKKCFDSATDIKLDGIQELYDVETDLDNMFHNGLQKGYMVGVPSVDNILSFKTGMLNIVTGIPTHGKTYMLNFLLARLNLLYDWKIAFFSPEFYPVSLHISQMIETMGGKRFDAKNYTQQAYEEMKAYISKNFFWIDPDETDINSVMERARYLIKKKGIKALVIDPFNALTDKEKKSVKQDEYISEFLQKLRWFARKYDVAVFIVMHPTKQVKQENGLYPVCDLYACKGASEINDKADIGLTVWRNELEDYAELHVTKIKFRHLGEKGRACFKFNLNNGRYVEIGNVDDMKKQGIVINTLQVNWDNSNWIIDKIKGNQVQQSLTYTQPEPNYENTPDNIPFGMPSAEEAPF